MEEVRENAGISRNPDGTFKLGFSGNPAGKPPGTLSIKDLVRQHLRDNPNDLREFVEHFIKKNKELAWQMLEGRPPQDITSGGEKLVPTPIYGGQSVPVQGHDGNKEDIPAQETN